MRPELTRLINDLVNQKVEREMRFVLSRLDNIIAFVQLRGGDFEDLKRIMSTYKHVYGESMTEVRPKAVEQSPRRKAAALVRWARSRERNKDRDEKIRKMWQEHATYKSIGEEVGLTAARVHQIVKAAQASNRSET